MPPGAMKALVFWTKDRQTGIEPITHVPEAARFEGAVTAVKFSGDKKHYPAKILRLSDDVKAIEKLAHEVESKIAETEAATFKFPFKRKRSVKEMKNSASDRALAIALGEKPPLPKHLEVEQKAQQQAKKDAKTSFSQGQSDLDAVIAGVVQRNLFSKSTFDRGTEQGTSSQNVTALDTFMASELKRPTDTHYEDSDCSGDDKEDQEAEADHSEDAVVHNEVSCSCATCTILLKYSTPLFLNFLEDLMGLLKKRNAKDESGGKKYLKLKEISSNVKQVELVAGRGIYIAQTDKDQLKVDFKNKPSALARETLYALYGQEAFQILTVTGCGTKQGTYAIPVEVLKAVCGFINRNVESSQAMKLSQLTSLINKRAPEWRKSSPKSKKTTKSSAEKDSLRKVISTSPAFKVRPLQPGTPIKDSPLKGSPFKTQQSLNVSPGKCQKKSPQKQPSASTESSSAAQGPVLPSTPAPYSGVPAGPFSHSDIHAQYPSAAPFMGHQFHPRFDWGGGGHSGEAWGTGYAQYPLHQSWTPSETSEESTFARL